MNHLGNTVYINGEPHDEPLTITHGYPILRGYGASPDGLGSAVFGGSARSALEQVMPLARDVRTVLNGLRGLGDDAATTATPDPTAPMAVPAAAPLQSPVNAGLLIAGVVLAVSVRAACGYVAGRAMAPSEADKNTYGWWGALAGGVFGTLGLAVEGAVALGHR